MRQSKASSCEVLVQVCLLLITLVLPYVRARAQQPPSAQAGSNSEAKSANPDQVKNDRIFGVIPNYRTVERPTQVIVPISAKEKFKLAAEDSFDPYAYFIAGAFAGAGQ